MKLPGVLLTAACMVQAQSWQQWGQNTRHTGAAGVSAQRVVRIKAQFTYDTLAEQIRRDAGGDLLVHYMAPLVSESGQDVYTLSRGNSVWTSCAGSQPPCGTARWASMQWGVTRLSREAGARLVKQWAVLSTWKPPPDTGSGWEPVFHPALSGDFLYMPGGAGSVVKVDRFTGVAIQTLQAFPDADPNRYVASPLTVDAVGAVYYTALRLDPSNPWASDVKEAWLVKVDAAGGVSKVAFASLVPFTAAGCTTSFASAPAQLPWPPAVDVKPPVAACGSQRPGLNAAPAVAPDGTVYVVSRAHFNSYYSFLVAVNSDLSPRWSASLRDRLNDGCDVLLPASGTVGGCRTGSLRGVDPATNELPAGRAVDQSTASPVIAPDGSVLYGAYTGYNYQRGHLMHFSSSGAFLNAYDFGWDSTPAVFEHDGTWSVIEKDNFYAVGSYCGVPGFCGQADGRYSVVSLNSALREEWRFLSTNDQLCQRSADGTVACQTVAPGFEWCVNMVAVDRDGTVFANSEDGNVYAIDRRGNLVGRLFLQSAIGAAYTPLAIGPGGEVYTQNDGTLFVVGEAARAGGVPEHGRRH